MDLVHFDDCLMIFVYFLFFDCILRYLCLDRTDDRAVAEFVLALVRHGYGGGQALPFDHVST